MNKEVIKKYKAEFDHWLNGGEVKVYVPQCIRDKWVEASEDDWNDDAENIFVIQDKHFEARKAYALGEEIESRVDDSYEWFSDSVPSFSDRSEYRPKPKTKTIVVEEWLIRFDTKEHEIIWTDDICTYLTNSDGAHKIKKLSERIIEIEE